MRKFQVHRICPEMSFRPISSASVELFDVIFLLGVCAIDASSTKSHGAADVAKHGRVDCV